MAFALVLRHSKNKMGLEINNRKYSELKYFSSLLSDYAESDPKLKNFISDFPNRESFSNQIVSKKESYNQTTRSLLVQKLRDQYKNTQLTEKQNIHLKNLESDNTFSVSCGHQLNIAGGPVYVVYKILTVIKLAEELKNSFPSYNFAPIHWLATEDHDLEEVSSFNFFGANVKVPVNHSGAVGRMNGEGIAEQLQLLKDFPEWMSAVYSSEKTLTESTREWIQKVFGNLGLLTLDADDADLKATFQKSLLQELMEPWVEKEVIYKSNALETLAYKPQIHARAINLFYLNGDERLRLESENNTIRTVDGKYTWTKIEALDFFTKNPEKLSPNVALRPLYSQVLLPDLAFVGGPAELAYWMQLGSVFEKGKTPFPLLIPRFSALYISASQSKKAEKLGLSISDLFKESHEIKKELVQNEWQRPSLENVYSELLHWAASVDQTLKPSLAAELSKMEKMVDGLEKRVQKATEQKNETQINQINGLISKLFPGGNLQERTESWISFLVLNPDWIAQIYDSISPMDFRFTILQEKV
jgi:bacillithiol biosynthesis cysteine-adding enzyme BshC